MTHNAIKVAMARVAGYRVEQVPAERLGPGADKYPYRLLNLKGKHVGTWWASEAGAWEACSTDWTVDRNALAAVWAGLDSKVRTKAIHHLMTGLFMAETDANRVTCPFTAILLSTPLQQCEAILRATGGIGLNEPPSPQPPPARSPLPLVPVPDRIGR